MNKQNLRELFRSCALEFSGRRKVTGVTGVYVKISEGAKKFVWPFLLRYNFQVVAYDALHTLPVLSNSFSDLFTQL